ncbi:MAG: SHOCT domain-containing protein [Nakamurella sp.]
MGLLGMMARTAVVAGTATAVSNRVSRRQYNRAQQKADAQAYQEQQQAPQQYQQAPPQYQQAPPQYQQPQYQQPQYQQPPAPPAAPTGAPNVVDELKRLAELKDQGILSADEFSAAKSKLLGI